MTEPSICKNRALDVNLRGARHSFFILLLCAILILAGCAHVPPRQQRLVSKPNMQFSDSAIFSYQDRLLSQFESGSAASVGGQSGDCGSCVAGGAQ